MKGYHTISVRDPQGEFARKLKAAAEKRGMKIGEFVRIACQTAHPDLFLGKMERFGTEECQTKEGEKE